MPRLCLLLPAVVSGLITPGCLRAPAAARASDQAALLARPPSRAWPMGAVEPAPIPAGAFVRAIGTSLVVGDRPFVFVGANFDGIHGPEQRSRLDQVLGALVEDGITVGRQWVVGEADRACPKGLMPYMYRCGPEGFVEPTYRQLDRVLAQARQRGIRVILTLSNQWGDYGGIPMYLRWAGLSSKSAGKGSSIEAFYSDPRVRSYFRAGLDRLLERTNTVTGVRYVDDPTIFSWELMNESSVATDAEAAARRRWIIEMARYIKARDPNHLLAAGLRGYALLSERQEWIEVHRLAEIDYCDSHLYPEEEPLITSWELLRDFLSDRALLSRAVIRKPLIIGEFGIHTDRSATWLGLPRAEWIARLVMHVRSQGAAGALVWIYQPYFGKPRDYGIYIDRPETDDIRRALRHAAQQVTARAPVRHS